MKTGYIHLCTAWFILLSLYQVAYAQKISRGGVDDLFPALTRYSPVLDSSINVAKLSLSARNKLIEKLFEVDQMYRISLNKVGWASESAEARHYWHLIAINDPVNQTILLKILKLDGWPCDKAKGEKSLSYKAWFVPWHDRGSYEGLNRFYPYLEKANKANCIEKSQFKKIDDLLKQMRTFRKNFADTH